MTRVAPRAVVSVTILAAVVASGAPAFAQEAPDGQTVYTSSCAPCHQPDGKGIPGTFPPLADNPHVADSEYVAGVIANGRTGEIEVDGVIYDGRMPAIDLSDAEVDAVISYIQSGFAEEAALPGLIPTEDGFPWGTLVLFAAAIVVAAGIVSLAYPPRGLTPRRTWWLAVVILLYFALATVWLPSHLLDDPALASWPDALREVMVSVVWLGALGAGVLGLRWAQRTGRI
jgi:mono/diheme cytochrome c family protein